MRRESNRPILVLGLLTHVYRRMQLSICLRQKMLNYLVQC